MNEALDIEKIRQGLEEEREKLLKQLQIPSANDQTMDKNLDQMDIAQAYNDQVLSHALQTSEGKKLIQVENALKAIAQGDYGRCQHCHQMISVERLQVMPNATMCVSCQTRYG